jgi:hypothetical protein
MSAPRPVPAQRLVAERDEGRREGAVSNGVEIDLRHIARSFGLLGFPPKQLIMKQTVSAF